MARSRGRAAKIATEEGGVFYVFFFFQAEDGIRDRNVTGVQRVLFRSATAFKNANIAAGFNTDLQGRQQLIFNSSTAAVQVQAGDRVANAVLGNFTSGSTGKDLTSTVAGVTTTATALANAVVLRIQGSGLATAVDITIAAGTAQAGLDSLYTQASQNA